MKNRELIKHYRKLLGLSQHKLAVEIGVTTSTVSNWEQGRREPSPLALKLLKLMVERKERENDIWNSQ
jgi:DNA-binding transcriptional regulator YiaG